MLSNRLKTIISHSAVVLAARAVNSLYFVVVCGMWNRIYTEAFQIFWRVCLRNSTHVAIVEPVKKDPR